VLRRVGRQRAACIVGSHGRADARRRLKELWEDLRLDAPSFLPAQVQRDLAFFGLPGFYAPRMDVWALPGWKYLYDTSPLIAWSDFCSRRRDRSASQTPSISLSPTKQLCRLRSISSVSVPGDSSATPQTGLSSK